MTKNNAKDFDQRMRNLMYGSVEDEEFDKRMRRLMYGETYEETPEQTGKTTPVTLPEMGGPNPRLNLLDDVPTEDQKPPVTEPVTPPVAEAGVKTPTPEPKPLPKGLITEGNIDLNKRPVVHRDDGKISTVNSITVGFDDGFYVIPTVTEEGLLLDNDQAVEYFKKTGKHLGRFYDQETADAFARQLHLDQEKMYGGQGEDKGLTDMAWDAVNRYGGEFLAAMNSALWNASAGQARVISEVAPDVDYGGILGGIGGVGATARGEAPDTERTNLVKGIDDWVQSSIARFMPRDQTKLDEIAQGFGSAAGYYAPGLAFNKLFGAAATALRSPEAVNMISALTRHGSGLAPSSLYSLQQAQASANALSRATVGISGGVMEGLSEAVGVFDDAIKNGMSKEDAFIASMKNAIMNIPIASIANIAGAFGEHKAFNSALLKMMDKVGLIKRIGLDRAMRVVDFFTRTISGGVSEFVQESEQGLSSEKFSTGKPWSEVLTLENIKKKGKDQGVVGGIVGSTLAALLGGGGVNIDSGLAQRLIEKYAENDAEVGGADEVLKHLKDLGFDLDLADIQAGGAPTGGGQVGGLLHTIINELSKTNPQLAQDVLEASRTMTPEEASETAGILREQINNNQNETDVMDQGAVETEAPKQSDNQGATNTTVATEKVVKNLSDAYASGYVDDAQLYEAGGILDAQLGLTPGTTASNIRAGLASQSTVTPADPTVPVAESGETSAKPAKPKLTRAQKIVQKLKESQGRGDALAILGNRKGEFLSEIAGELGIPVDPSDTPATLRNKIIEATGGENARALAERAQRRIQEQQGQGVNVIPPSGRAEPSPTQNFPLQETPEQDVQPPAPPVQEQQGQVPEVQKPDTVDSGENPYDDYDSSGDGTVVQTTSQKMKPGVRNIYEEGRVDFETGERKMYEDTGKVDGIGKRVLRAEDGSEIHVSNEEIDQKFRVDPTVQTQGAQSVQEQREEQQPEIAREITEQPIEQGTEETVEETVEEDPDYPEITELRSASDPKEAHKVAKKIRKARLREVAERLGIEINGKKDTVNTLRDRIVEVISGEREAQTPDVGTEQGTTETPTQAPVVGETTQDQTDPEFPEIDDLKNADDEKEAGKRAKSIRKPRLVAVAERLGLQVDKKKDTVNTLRKRIVDAIYGRSENSDVESAPAQAQPTANENVSVAETTDQRESDPVQEPAQEQEDSFDPEPVINQLRKTTSRKEARDIIKGLTKKQAITVSEKLGITRDDWDMRSPETIKDSIMDETVGTAVEENTVTDDQISDLREKAKNAGGKISVLDGKSMDELKAIGRKLGLDIDTSSPMVPVKRSIVNSLLGHDASPRYRASDAFEVSEEGKYRTTEFEDETEASEKSVSDDKSEKTQDQDVKSTTPKSEPVKEQAKEHPEEKDVKGEDKSASKGTVDFNKRITFKFLKKAFPKEKVYNLGKGLFKIIGRNGKTAYVALVKRIDIDPVAFKKANKRLPTPEEMARGGVGSSELLIDGTSLIQITADMTMTAENVNERFYLEDSLTGEVFETTRGTEMARTIFHESYHTASDMVLSKKEKALLTEKYGSEEAQADAYMDWLLNRESKSTVGRIFQRIYDFFSTVRSGILGPNSESVFLDINKGQAWARESGAKKGDTSYRIQGSLRLNDESLSPKDKELLQKMDEYINWEPQRTKDGKILGAPEWVKTDKDLKKLRKLLKQFVDEGISARYWYEDSGLEVIRMVGGNVEDAAMFTQILAIFSPKNKVDNNTTAAIKAWNMYKRGVPESEFHVATSTQDQKAKNVLYHGDKWEGRKTGSFYSNLMFEILKDNPELAESLGIDTDKLKATIDLWMYRAFGYTNEQGSNDQKYGRYTFAESSIIRLAAELNRERKPGEPIWTPHQVQAAIWTAMKTRYEHELVKKKTNELGIKQGIIKMKNGKPVYPKEGTPERKQHLQNWRKFALEIPDSAWVKEEAERTGVSFADYIKRMTEHITLEVIPSSKFNAEINNASAEARRAFTERVMGEIILDENGNDQIAQLLDVPISRVEIGDGAYAGGVNPNIITSLVPDKAREYDSQGNPKTTLAFNHDNARAYAKIVQYVFKQDAVPWFNPNFVPLSKKAIDDQKFKVVTNRNGKRNTVKRFDTLSEAEAYIAEKGTSEHSIVGGDKAHAVMLSFSDDLTGEKLDSLLRLLETKFGESAGFTKMSDREVAIINFRDDETKIPFLDDKVFFDSLSSIKENLNSLGVTTVDQFYSEGEYGYVHDWEADNTGSAILDSDLLRERSDIQERVHVWRNVFEELLKEFSGENLRNLEETLNNRGGVRGRSAQANEGSGTKYRVGSETQTTERPFKVEPDGSVRLFHWGNQSGLTSLDPSKHGTGIRGAESKRRENDPKNYVPRIYFGMNEGGYVKEPRLSNNKYEASVKLDELYDFGSDPDGFKAKAYEKAGPYAHDDAITLAEKMISDAGYKGMWVNTRRDQNRSVAVLFTPTEVKSVPYSEESTNPEGGTPKYRIAFHGTPYRFNKFSKEFISTGEGYQKYGWGLYFAERKETAEDYRKNLQGLMYDGGIRTDNGVALRSGVRDWDYYNDDDIDNPVRVTDPVEIYAYDLMDQFRYDKDYTLERIDDWLQNPEKTTDSILDNVRDDEERELIRKARDFIRKTPLEKTEPGQLYEAEIPDDDVLLDLDTPFEEQPRPVYDALRMNGFFSSNTLRNRMRKELSQIMDEEGLDEYDAMLELERRDNRSRKTGNLDQRGRAEADERERILRKWFDDGNQDDGYGLRVTGEEIYTELTDKLGSPKKASEYLNSIGIKGLRYLDAGSRADGDGTHNFVIFDDETIDIVKTHYRMAFHATRAKFDRPSMAYVGSGLGENKYGWGFYVTHDESYADALKRGMVWGQSTLSMSNGEYRKRKVSGIGDVWTFTPAGSSDNQDIDRRSTKGETLALIDEYMQSIGDEKFDPDKLIEEVSYILGNRRLKEGSKLNYYFSRNRMDFGSMESQMLYRGVMRELRGMPLKSIVRKDSEAYKYTMEIPEADVMLNWGVPLSEQPKPMIDALNSMDDDTKSAIGIGDGLVSKMTGEPMRVEELIDTLDEHTGSSRATSLYLNSLGIEGIDYGTRDKASQGRLVINSVIFNTEAIKNVGIKYRLKGGMSQSSHPITAESIRKNMPGMKVYDFRDGIAVIGLWNGNYIAVDTEREIPTGSNLSFSDIGPRMKYDNVNTDQIHVIDGNKFVSMVDGISRDGVMTDEAFEFARDMILKENESARLDKKYGSIENQKAMYRKFLGMENYNPEGINEVFRKMREYFTSLRNKMFGKNSSDVVKKIALEGRGEEQPLTKSLIEEWKTMLVKDANDFRDKVKEFIRNGGKGTKPITMMVTPVSMWMAQRQIGIRDPKFLPIIIEADKLRKILFEKHSDQISEYILSEVPKALAEPMMILRETATGNGKKLDDLTFVLMLKDKNGSTVNVILGLNKTMMDDGGTESYIVNYIKSVYARSRESTSRPTSEPIANNQWYLEQANSGRLLYIDTDMARMWGDLSGLKEGVDSLISREVDEEGRVLTQYDLEDTRTYNQSGARYRVASKAKQSDAWKNITNAYNLEEVVDPTRAGQTLKERISSAWNWWKREILDDISGVKKHFGKDIYIRTTNAIHGINSRAEALIRFGEKGKGVKGLYEIFDTMPVDEQDGFMHYAVYKHLQDIAENTDHAIASVNYLEGLADDERKIARDYRKKMPLDPKDKSNLEHNAKLHETLADEYQAQADMARKQIHETRAKADDYKNAIAGLEKQYPHWKNAQKDLAKYSRYLLWKLQKSGIISKNLYDVLVSRYPNYIPLQRDFGEEGAMESFSSSRGIVNLTSPIKKLKGSRRDVKDPLFQIVSNTYAFEGLIGKQNAAVKIAEMADQGQLAGLVDPTDDRRGTPGEYVFHVWEDGKKKFYKTDQDIYTALVMSSRDAGFGGGIDVVLKILSIPVRVLRAGVTHGVGFILRNPQRDTVNAGMVGDHFTPIVTTLKGAFSLLSKKDGWFEEFMKSGAMQGVSYLSSKTAGDIVKSIRMGKGTTKFMNKMKNPVRAIWDLLGDVAQFTELATRVGQYRVLRERGVDMGKAAYESRDLLNYQRGGRVSRAISKVNPFFNAQVQGVEKGLRSMYHDGKIDVKTIARGMLYITLPSMLVTLWNYGDDDRRKKYLSIPAWQRNLFWNIVIGEGDDAWILKLPKPFDLGLLFGSIPERAMDYLYADDPKAFDDLGSSVLDAVSPETVPLFLGTVVEWMANYSFFRQSTIVPMGEQNLEGKLQYGPYTSEIAKWAGERFNISPRKIDHLISQTTGNLGKEVSGLIDKGVRAVKDETRPARDWYQEIPGVASFAVPAKAMKRWEQVFYDERYDLDKQLRSAKRVMETRGRKALEPDEKRVLGSENAIKRVNRYFTGKGGINDLKKEINKIAVAPKMSAEAKKRRIDMLQKRIAKMVERGLKDTARIRKYLSK